MMCHFLIYFAVWAPNATSVSLIGNFNCWNRQTNIMLPRWDHSGIWELFVPGLGKGEYYKYYIEGKNGYNVEKATRMLHIGRHRLRLLL